jgi:YVTN family beta-propeller protein
MRSGLPGLRPFRSLAALAAIVAAAASAEEPHRSPVDLVLGGDGAWLVTVNQTANSASLVRTSDGQVLDEVAVGEHPVFAALHPGGNRVLVSGAWSGDVTILEVAGEKLLATSKIYVGFEPYGMAVSPDGKEAYVAQWAADRIAVVDLEAAKVIDHIDVGRRPRYLALSPDGARLAAGVSGDRGAAVVDPIARKVIYQQSFAGLNIGHLQASRDGNYAYFPWMTYRDNPITPGNIRLGWVLASRIGRLNLHEESRRDALSLDPPGKAVADPFGLAITSNEERMVVSSSGTQELLVYRLPDLPLRDYGSPDHIPEALLKDSDRFFRIPVGGRPMGLRIAADDRTVYVANYLDDAVQVVDLEQRSLVRSIPLGGPEEVSLVRRGEAIFYDARRSLDQWYSCHSCHDAGGSNDKPMDTRNDGNVPFTFKTVLPLYHVAETAPWTWHGWQEDYDAAMRKSLTETMLGPPPSDDDVAALGAFLKTLQPPPNPFRNADGSLGEAAVRGEAIFHSEKAGCASCHSGPYFTDGQIHDVGLGAPGDRYKGFNTPSLLAVYRKTLLLHDGRANTLEEVLTGAHAPEKVAGQEKLTDEELADLIAYLKSL